MAKLARPVAEQCRRTFLDRSHPRELYQAVIKAFANAATAHFNVLQDFHRALLHLAKEDDQAIQLASLRGLQAMWTSDAQPDLIACKPESMPTIAELLEIGGQVEQETKALLSTMAEGEEDAEMAMDDVETDSQDGDDSD